VLDTFVMSLKRPLDLYDSPESSSPPRGPTTKRRHITYLFPSPSSSPTIHTPRTPPRPRAHPIPFDSPTNPFGRKSSLNLTLPRTTSFGKHLPLRFQLVRDGIRGNSRDGVYRIVQVPLNYTFRHLHKLLLFLFGGHPVSVSPSKTIAPHRGRTRPSVAPSKGKATERDDQGHLFEVQKFITLYNAMYKPGQIKSARTLVKLSSVRDPYRYRGEDDFAGYGDGSEEGIAADVAGADGEDDVWWEAEEDFLLSNAWPNGGELSRGIIYVRPCPAYPRIAFSACALLTLPLHSITIRTHKSTLQSTQLQFRPAKA
jgi:hypothetical protein